MCLSIISRKEAKEKGLIRYYTGKPCKRGHIVERQVSNLTCIECSRLACKNIADAPYMRQYRIKNLIKIKENEKRSRIKNWENEKTRKNNWCKNNPDIRRVYSAERRSRLKNVSGKHTSADIALILKRQKHKCVYCLVNVKNNYHVDHKMPIVLGGTNDPSNLQITCPSCNLSKSRKHPIDFANEIGLLF